MWKVCELEEEVEEFAEFYASAVPEKWILKLKDGSLICCWPKTNPGQKIRNLVSPNLNGPDFTSYKCRISMEGGITDLKIDIDDDDDV